MKKITFNPPKSFYYYKMIPVKCFHIHIEWEWFRVDLSAKVDYLKPQFGIGPWRDFLYDLKHGTLQVVKNIMRRKHFMGE